MATKRDQLVLYLASLYGNRFADVLNALWLRGVPMDTLTKTVATSGKGTNDATDIVTRLLNSGITADQIQQAVGTPAPPGTQFAFIQTDDRAKIVAHQNPAPIASESGNILEFVSRPPAAPNAGYTPAPAPVPPPSSAARAGAGPPGAVAPPTTPPPPTKATPAQIRAQVQARYGWAAALQDIPEVAKILDDAAQDRISVDEVEARFRATDYYKRTTQAEREWTVFEKASPADAQARRQEQQRRITTAASRTGVTAADPRRLAQIVDLSLRLGWSDQQINEALASEVRYDPQGAKTGVFARLSGLVREWLVPVSDRAMEGWAASMVAGTKTEDDFQEYLRTQAKSLFPALGAALDDPNLTTRQYLDPYGQIASKVLGINDADIDWMDPKWSRFINQVDQKTGQRTVMSLADMQRTLMADSTYGYDQTANGKAEKASLARGILEQFGFSSSTRGFG